jgi:hypothetical protein
MQIEVIVTVGLKNHTRYLYTLYVTLQTEFLWWVLSFCLVHCHAHVSIIRGDTGNKREKEYINEKDRKTSSHTFKIQQFPSNFKNKIILSWHWNLIYKAFWHFIFKKMKSLTDLSNQETVCMSQTSFPGKK